MVALPLATMARQRLAGGAAPAPSDLGRDRAEGREHGRQSARSDLAGSAQGPQIWRWPGTPAIALHTSLSQIRRSARGAFCHELRICQRRCHGRSMGRELPRSISSSRLGQGRRRGRRGLDGWRRNVPARARRSRWTPRSLDRERVPTDMLAWFSMLVGPRASACEEHQRLIRPAEPPIRPCRMSHHDAFAIGPL